MARLPCVSAALCLTTWIYLTDIPAWVALSENGPAYENYNIAPFLFITGSVKISM
jgi:hypothetical protein